MVKLKSTTSKLFFFLLAYLPLRFLVYFLAVKWGLPHINLVELASEVYIGLIGLYLIVTNVETVWAKLKRPDRWPLIIKLIIALLIWGLISLAFTTAELSQALRGLRLDLLGLGLAVLIWLIPPQPDETAQLFTVAYWSTLFLAAVGLINLVFGSGFLHALGFAPYQFFAGKIEQIHSLLPSPNMFGSSMVVLTALLYRRQEEPSWWLASLVGLLAGASYSRSAWLALAVLGAGIFFYGLRRGQWRWSVGWLALGLALGVVLGVVRYHGSVHSVATHDDSTKQHAQAYARASNGFTKFNSAWLIGSGIGTAGPASFKGDTGTRIAESWYIQLFQELGMIGLLLFIAIMATLVRQLWQTGEVVMALLAVALSVNALFLHIWADDRYVHIVFWTIVSLAAFVARPTRKRATK